MEISLTTYYFGRRSVIFSESLNTIPYWSMSESQKQIKMRGPATLSHCSHSDSFYGQNVNASYIIIILGAALSRWYGIQVTCPKNCIVTESAQTWPRDANLLRSKNLEILSFTLSTWMPMLPPPLTNWTSPQIMIWEWLRTLYEVLHGVHTIKLCLHHWNNLCQWLRLAKSHQKPYCEYIKFEFWQYNIKHRKAKKSILSRSFGDLYGRVGDRYCV